MKLVLPLPPSANRYWRVVHGRAVKSAEARQYRNTCGLSLALQWRRKEPLAGRVRVHLDVYMESLRGDLDNRIKQVFDVMQGTVLVNDSQVWDLRAVRHTDRVEPRVEITVEEMYDASRLG